MKHLLLFLMALILICGASIPAQAANAFGPGEFQDDDGDGIPNCEDPDYIPPLDGSGYKWGYYAQEFSIFIGHLQIVCPRSAVLLNTGLGTGPKGWAWGPNDGTGEGLHLEDGTGWGPGDCK